MITLHHDALAALFERLSTLHAKSSALQALVTIISQKEANLYEALLNNKPVTIKSDTPLPIDTIVAKLSRIAPKEFTLVQILTNAFTLPERITPTQSTQLTEQFEHLSQKRTALTPSFLLQQLSQSQNSETFQFISQQLLAMRHDVAMLPLFFTQTEQSPLLVGYFQYKKRYNTPQNSPKQSVEFYAAMQYIGEIEGVISLVHNTTNVTIQSPSSYTIDTLQHHLEQTPLPYEVSFVHQVATPIFGMQTSLLDLNI